MSFADTLEKLEAAAEDVMGWLDTYLPSAGDASRCFEFATLLDVTARIAAVVGGAPPRVVTGPKGTFAGSPGNKASYNYVRVGPYYVYLGVCFPGQSKLYHAPDVVIAHENDPNRPILVVECKHYSGKALPKPIVMAFVGLLCDLLWNVYRGCRKLNPGNLYPGNTLQELPAVAGDAGNSVCSTFNMCKSQLATTIPASGPMNLLEQRYEFEVIVKKPWQDVISGTTSAAVEPVAVSVS